MHLLKRSLFVLPLLGALFAAACGDDSGPNKQAATGGSASGGDGQGGASQDNGLAACEALGSLCHDADSGPGVIGDCHEVGHARDEKECKSQFASCITACVTEESSAGGAPTQAVTNPYCQALGELCHFLNDEGTPTGECHEVGHTGNEPDCVKAFAGCVPLCIVKRETENGHDKTGGAGGQAGTHDEGGAHATAGGAGGAAGAGG